VPQAVNLNTWPATLFVGRDGKVKATHAWFAGPSAGPFNAQLKDEFTSTIERLLKDNGEQKTESFQVGQAVSSALSLPCF
jgi:hypothetical protein